MSKSASKRNPPLALALPPALAAMTALQAIVALALFAPGILAPKIGVSEGTITLFTFACFATSILGAVQGGALVRLLGSFRLAACCMAAVVAAMMLCAGGTPWMLMLAGIALGLAFGPETTASSAVLGRIARAQQRPLVFSIRQTGNQLGAILGSITLPALALLDPRLGYGLVAILALTAGGAFLLMGRRYDSLTRGDGSAIQLGKALVLLRDSKQIYRLAVISVPLSAMQLCLNAFLVTFLVGTLNVGHIAAGIVLGTAQAGGLLGRLFWGAVAGRWISTQKLIAALSVATAGTAVTMAILPAGTSAAMLAASAFVLGLFASGWNGVFLAEIVRVAPEGRMAEATGAVLTASYTGLLLGPLVISGLATLGGLRLSFAVLAIPCGLAGVWLWTRPRQ